MHHIIYLSQATVPFEETHLEQLLTQSRANNAQHGITGILLYGNEQFLQIIEGEEATVRALYAHICQDARHRDVTTYADKAITTRAFADWRMAFQPLVPRQLLDYASYLALADVHLERPGLSDSDQQLLQLLRSFVEPEAAPSQLG
jgi:hypothetical protein